jgi:hypothetical protein
MERQGARRFGAGTSTLHPDTTLPALSERRPFGRIDLQAVDVPMVVQALKRGPLDPAASPPPAGSLLGHVICTGQGGTQATRPERPGASHTPGKEASGRFFRLGGGNGADREGMHSLGDGRPSAGCFSLCSSNKRAAAILAIVILSARRCVRCWSREGRVAPPRSAARATDGDVQPERLHLNRGS